MPDTKDSSVLFSLKELMKIEQTRLAEEYAKVESIAAEERAAHAESERRAREEEAARRAAEEERRRNYEHQRRLQDAEIEAAKAMAIEMKRLETQHRLEMEARAQLQAHEKQVAVLAASRPKASIGPWIFALAAIGAGALGAIGYFGFVRESQAAKTALGAAETLCGSTDPSDWEKCEDQLAIARSIDGSNPRIAALAAKVATSKRDARDAEAATNDALKRDLDKAKEERDRKAKELLELKNRPAIAPTVTTKPASPPPIAATKPTTKPSEDKCKPGMPMCP